MPMRKKPTRLLPGVSEREEALKDDTFPRDLPVMP